MADRVVVVGEALVDVVPGPDGRRRELPGGSPANVAVTLARLGRPTHLLTTLGRDARGDAVRRWLTAAGVTVHATEPRDGRTSVAEVVLQADRSAHYRFDLTWDLPEEALAASGVGTAAAPAVLHVGSVATVLDPGAATVAAAVRAAHGRSLVTFDPNARPAVTPDVASARARVEDLRAWVDVVKVSAEDVDWYHPGSDPVDVASSWLSGERGPVLVVVTLGGDGSVLLRRSPDGVDEVRVPAPRVEVADTIGAGDTFTGALIDALVAAGAHGAGARARLATLDLPALRRAGVWAAGAAAVTVSRPGADPPTRAELLERLASPGGAAGDLA